MTVFSGLLFMELVGHLEKQNDELELISQGWTI